LKALLASGALALALTLSGQWELIGFSVMPFLVFHGLAETKKKKQAREIREKLPLALFQAASLSNVTCLEDVVKKLGQSGHGRLSQLFTQASNQVENGIPLEKALQDSAKQSNSVLYSRTVKILARGHSNGGDLSMLLREAAEDSAKATNVLREQASNTSLEKYTLLLGGGIIVPVIMGVVSSLVTGIGFIDLWGAQESFRQAVVSNAGLGVRIYLAEYALLASAWVGMQEGKPENFFFYSCLLLPLGQTLFFLAKNTGIVF
jgi:hypothetical protein